MMAYLFRERVRRSEAGISDISSYLRRQVFGGNQFNIEFDADRHALFGLLLDEPIETSADQLEAKVDSISLLTEGSKRLFQLFTHIDGLLSPPVRGHLLPYFADYLTERVYLFEIGVPSEQDGHKVFVTMNDRGLRLGPIDLLKGFLLSNISNPEMNARANEKWVQCIRELRQIGPDEDSAFFKAFLRAQYAESIRGKSRGAPPGDFEVIGDAYHRWAIDNCSKIGLQNSDDFFNFVHGLIPRHVDLYKQLRLAERVYSPEFPSVYFNGARDLTLQTLAILASIAPNDTSSDIERKVRLVSYYLDCYTSLRVVNRKDNNYDNIREAIFALSKKIRRLNVDALADELASQLSGSEDKLNRVHRMDYSVMKRTDLLHFLARLANELEESIEQTNRVGFPTYISRSRGSKNFDIEHVLPNDDDLVSDDLGAESDFDDPIDIYAFRDLLGALILLPRSRNRSLQDQPYSKKLPKYATENVLAQTLTESFYENNPAVIAFVAGSGIDLAPIAHFNLDAIERRGRAYEALAERIWSVNRLRALA